MNTPGFFRGTGMPDAGWWGALRPKPEKVLAGVGVPGGITAVDLCCGDGRFTLPIAQITRHVTAIDMDAAFLKIARARTLEAGVANSTFIEADASASQAHGK